MKFTQSELRNNHMPLLRRLERKNKIELERKRNSMAKKNSLTLKSKRGVSSFMSANDILCEEDSNITRLGRYTKRRGR